MKPCFDAVKQDHSHTTTFLKRFVHFKQTIFDINNVFDAVKTFP